MNKKIVFGFLLFFLCKKSQLIGLESLNLSSDSETEEVTQQQLHPNIRVSKLDTSLPTFHLRDVLHLKIGGEERTIGTLSVTAQGIKKNKRPVPNFWEEPSKKKAKKEKSVTFFEDTVFENKKEQTTFNLLETEHIKKKREQAFQELFAEIKEKKERSIQSQKKEYEAASGHCNSNPFITFYPENITGMIYSIKLLKTVDK